jgi:hypothetical protein
MISIATVFGVYVYFSGSVLAQDLCGLSASCLATEQSESLNQCVLVAFTQPTLAACIFNSTQVVSTNVTGTGTGTGGDFDGISIFY